MPDHRLNFLRARASGVELRLLASNSGSVISRAERVRQMRTLLERICQHCEDWPAVQTACETMRAGIAWHLGDAATQRELPHPELDLYQVATGLADAIERARLTYEASTSAAGR